MTVQQSVQVGGNRVAGKVAVITGGGGGIGAATAFVLASEGAEIALLDMDPLALERVKKELPGNVVCRTYQVDVANPRDVTETFGKLHADFGRLDILVNGAGIAPRLNGERLDFFNLDEAMWANIIGVNLSGAFFCSYAAARLMKVSQGGVIINVGSLARGTWTGSPSAAYVASKAGLDGLTRAMALELLEYDIRVNAVAPGRVETQMTAAASRSHSEKAVAMIPFGRLAKPSEIASCVLFLASDESSYMVGATIDVSGGRALV